MEKKTCKVCGETFKAFKPEFDTCPDCKNGKRKPTTGGANMHSQQHSGGSRGGGGQSHSRSNDFGHQRLPSKLKLQDGFFDEHGSIRQEIYQDIAKEIADIFNETNMKPASVRPFFEAVRVSYENYQRDPDRSFPHALESLNRLRPIANYKQKRAVTQPCFTDFLEHYIDLTSKDPRNLRGFKELFMSIIGYMKK